MACVDRRHAPVAQDLRQPVVQGVIDEEDADAHQQDDLYGPQAQDFGESTHVELLATFEGTAGQDATHPGKTKPADAAAKHDPGIKLHDATPVAANQRQGDAVCQRKGQRAKIGAGHIDAHGRGAGLAGEEAGDDLGRADRDHRASDTEKANGQKQL